MPGDDVLDGAASPRQGSVNNDARSDISSDMIAQMGNLVGGNLAGMGGLPGYLILVFPKLLNKLARYPRLAKLLSFALTLALASYLNFSMMSTAISTTWQYFISLFTASVTLSGQDPIIDQVQTWLRKVPMFLPSTSLRGESNYLIKKREADGGDWDYDDDGQRIEKAADERPFKIILHRNNQLQLFRHKGRYFLVKKDGADNLYDPSSVSSMTFFCFGWSPKPITELLAEIDKSQKTVQEERWTSIRTHEQHGYGNWSRPQSKLARPITSVDLDQGQRDMIVNDLAEYLDPATKQWYHRLGIPYRRGYMFYGPPGTGKSSLAMALAGHFKLDIHVLSLLDKNMNDHSLNRLMKSMSGKPLVLIEDIDSCGIGRDFDDDDDSDDESDDGWRRPKQTRSHVTLSGLLNAIDGVGAPEGHVLIMSTNHIEKMDEALVRAGRVDIKVKLDWCSRSQTRDIFLRMYSQNYKRRAASTEGQHNYSQAALEEMAGKFSERIPEFQVSPAELQDFILMRKSNPLKALDEVGDWANKMIQDRKEAEEEAEKRKNKKNKKKTAAGDGSDSEGEDGSRTPPPAFEDVAVSKESWLRWMRKVIMVEYNS
jgi:mitochondrial chaperone BCS1